MPRSTLLLMVLLAGCAAEAPAPQAPVPAAPAPEAARPAQDTLGWVPDALAPAGVPNVNLPYAGDLDHPVVFIQDNRYQPYYTHVRLGGTVTWINRDRTTHSVTSPVPGGSTQEGFWEGVLAPGESYTKTFNRFVGTFTYYSKEEAVLHGNVIVVGKAR